MRWFLLWLALWPTLAHGQSRTVLPDELSLEVILANPDLAAFEQEMVLITIRGIYRRHITRETLKQPDLDGFNWMQLGPDSWSEERIRGQKVKVLERRMALFPERSGRLTIGAFTHELTLTDERVKWFVHNVSSEPVTIEVAKAPVSGDWWLPVRALRISDQWSNAPDQLKPGEGVLRVIRLEAVGAAPDMIPPMPELTSPSAMIFPHPEKRLVELSPEGPVTYAFWRWTIRPANDVSAILEPINLSFFDTSERLSRAVTISAQRIAFEDTGSVEPVEPPKPSKLPGAWIGGLAILSFAIASGWLLRHQSFAPGKLRHSFPFLDPLAWRLRRAERRGHWKELRRLAHGFAQRTGKSDKQSQLLASLDQQIFGPHHKISIPKGFARSLLAARKS